MREIRTDLTQHDIVINMLELAAYLAQQDNGENKIDVTVRNLHMSFEAYTTDEENK